MPKEFGILAKKISGIYVKQKERECGNNLGGATRVSPRAPSGRIRFADVVWQIFQAGARSGYDAFEEFQHLPLSIKLYLSPVLRQREISKSG